MMKIFIFLSMFFLFQSKTEKIFSKEDIVCYFDYAVTKQWELELKEQGTFILTYKKKDSRVKKVNKFNFIGTWVNKNDIIILTTLSPSSNECYFKMVEYVVSEDGLYSSAVNICLPTSFKAGNRFTVKL